MQMIRQHAYCNRLKGMPRPNRLQRRAQTINLFDEQPAAPVGQIDREEIRAAGNNAASVTGHAETVARMRWSAWARYALPTLRLLETPTSRVARSPAGVVNNGNAIDGSAIAEYSAVRPRRFTPG